MLKQMDRKTSKLLRYVSQKASTWLKPRKRNRPEELLIKRLACWRGISFLTKSAWQETKNLIGGSLMKGMKTLASCQALLPFRFQFNAEWITWKTGICNATSAEFTCILKAIQEEEKSVRLVSGQRDSKLLWISTKSLLVGWTKLLLKALLVEKRLHL
jgi:hypothetical protein